MSLTESKYEKEYRPMTGYRKTGEDEAVRGYWNSSNMDKEQYHANYSKSPHHSKYSPRDPILTTPLTYTPKYDPYTSSSPTTSYPYSTTTSLKSVFSNRKVTISDFHLGKNLGEGKFGTVYQAFDKKTKSIYALKKIPKSVIKSHWMIDQFIL